MEIEFSDFKTFVPNSVYVRDTKVPESKLLLLPRRFYVPSREQITQRIVSESARVLADWERLKQLKEFNMQTPGIESALTQYAKETVKLFTSEDNDVMELIMNYCDIYPYIDADAGKKSLQFRWGGTVF